MISPVLTEKSYENAKKGTYTFYVPVSATKNKIRDLISKIFKVQVKSIRTIKIKGEIKKTLRGKKRTIKPRKKALVTLAEGEKIDLFDTK